MTGSEREGGTPDERSAPVGETDFSRRLGRLEDALEQAERRRDGGGRGPDKGSPSPLGMAFRIGTELVAGLLVGGLIGWQLDAWLGTRPALFLIFIAVGAAAGILNVFRYADRMHRMAQDQTKAGGGTPPGPSGDGERGG